jgi:DNA-binding CsgD family transcriptional regulator
VVSEAGRVIEMNCAAEEIVARHDGLYLDANRLAAMHNSDDSGLNALIASAAASHGGADEAPPGGTIALSRPSGKRPLSVLVFPVSTSLPALGCERPAAVVFVGDPERSPEPVPDRLRRLYGLTRCEARLAAHIAAGRCLDDTAEQMGITRETARTHLKRVFAKTDTRRQGELVALLLCGPAPFRPA